MLTHGIYPLTPDWETNPNDAVWGMLEQQLPWFLKNCPAKAPKAVVFLAWEATLKNSLRRKLTHQMLNPKAKILWGAPNKKSQRLLQNFGMTAEVLQANLFCRNDIFQPPSEGWQTSRQTALHVAALTDYKRHHLASQVRPLLIIARDASKSNPSDIKKFLAKNRVAHAKVNQTWTPPDQLKGAMHDCACLLALSQIEGAMLAVTEALLTGLPIVSTRSRGGRSHWFCSNNHILVDDSEASVARGVQLWQQRWKTGKINPEEIAKTAREDLAGMRHALSYAIKLHYKTTTLPVDYTSKSQQFLLQTKTGYQLTDIYKNPCPPAISN
jgi:glycosyltransferase involved in cell wall biosynthesis